MYIVCKIRSLKKSCLFCKVVWHFTFFTTYLFRKYQYIYLNTKSNSPKIVINSTCITFQTFFFEMHVKEFVNVCFSERVASQFVNKWSVTCLPLVSMEKQEPTCFKLRNSKYSHLLLEPIVYCIRCH